LTDRNNSAYGCHILAGLFRNPSMPAFCYRGIIFHQSFLTAFSVKCSYLGLSYWKFSFAGMDIKDGFI
jgi:hypothetical protein